MKVSGMTSCVHISVTADSKYRLAVLACQYPQTVRRVSVLTAYTHGFNKEIQKAVQEVRLYANVNLHLSEIMILPCYTLILCQNIITYTYTDECPYS